MSQISLVVCQDKCPEVTHIDFKKLKGENPHVNRWSVVKDHDDKVDAVLSAGNVCKDICLIKTHCTTHKDYNICVDYPEKMTLLIFGVKGYSKFWVSDSSHTYTVRVGDVWLVNVDVNEKFFRAISASQENEMMFIRYSSHRFDNEDGSCEFSSKVIRLGREASIDNDLLSLFNNALDTPAHRIFAESQSLEILARWMVPDNDSMESTPRLTGHKMSKSELDAIKGVMEVIISDLVHPPSLHELADQANMSHAKLNRCFKKVYGTTVYDWLRCYRMERAKHYVCQMECSITDIAFKCGFSSASHFAQAFKQKYGCSPVEYRLQSVSELIS